MIEEKQDGNCQRCGGKGCIACDARVLPKCQHCEYHKNRAARWRAEAYKQVGKEVELPWVGLTENEAFACRSRDYFETYKAIEAKLKGKNT